jgi:hypothetical protein
VRIADLHITIMQKVFGCSITSFGVPGASKGIIPEILA